MAGSDQTPVIVCNRSSEHLAQALGCLAASRGRSPSPSVGRTSVPPQIPASTILDTPLTSTSLHTPATGSTPVGRVQLSAPVRKQVPDCNKCCCASHHRVEDHKPKRVKRAEPPSPACDLSDLKLTFSDQATGLKDQDQFESVNQMIWSCELDLNN